MEILATIDSKKVKRGAVSGVIEICRTVERNKQHDSADSRAGRFKQDIYRTVAYFIQGGERKYLCDVVNDFMSEALETFEIDFRRFVPRL